MLSPYNEPNNAKNGRMGNTLNNHSDMQTRNTQGHNISNVPNNLENTGIIKQTPIIGTNEHIEKTDENINTQT